MLSTGPSPTSSLEDGLRSVFCKFHSTSARDLSPFTLQTLYRLAPRRVFDDLPRPFHQRLKNPFKLQILWFSPALSHLERGKLAQMVNWLFRPANAFLDRPKWCSLNARNRPKRSFLFFSPALLHLKRYKLAQVAHLKICTGPFTLKTVEIGPSGVFKDFYRLFHSENSIDWLASIGPSHKTL